jgi:hypothetical protein
MTTTAQVREAERLNRQRRVFLARQFLVVDETGASEADIALAKRVKAAAMGDGAAYDKALADPRVNDLYLRGILKFVRPAG